MRRLAIVLACLAVLPADAQPGSFPPDDLAAAARLRDAALAGSRAYDRVSSLTTEVGPRQAGTAGDKAAVAWAQRQLTEAGLENLRLQPVMVPHWERGTIEARVVSPWPQAVVATALGGSIGTAEAGLEAEVVAFDTLEALRAATREQVQGRIVYLGQRAQRGAGWNGYSEAVTKRTQGPSVAAALGAKALLIRSVGTSNARVAHTGTTVYASDAPRIPAAALSNPDADLLERMLASGRLVRFFLRSTARDLPDEPSANVMAELPGSDLRDEIVLIGAHLDSWDLGTGAIDDGAGVAIAIEVAAMMKRLGIQPRRTVRVVLFASEERTVAGGKEYARLPDEELARHVLLMEADSGAGRAVGLQSRVPEDRLPLIAAMAAVLAPLGVTQGSNEAGGGADISATMARGVPSLTIQQDLTDYLDAHHSPNDNLDKVDRRVLDQVLAAYLPAVYLAAQAEGGFGRNEPAQAARK